MLPSPAVVAPDEAAETAALFALLADPLRLRIVQALAQEQLCTCHLEEITGAKQTTVSHHLRALREARIVVGEADGRFTWYRLAPGAFAGAVAALTGVADAGPAGRLRLPCVPAPSDGDPA